MESVLEKKINRIESIINVSEIIDQEVNSTKDIQKYYRINNLAYRLFHSKKGFMHFRVTKGRVMKDDDFLYQLNVISEYIPENGKVLELGPGQGANLLYLSKKHPDASFIGVDLYSNLKKVPKNVKLYQHDYSYVPFIEDHSIDVVYGIETIVHSSDKEKIFKEMHRVLKEDGKLIIYDYSLKKELEEYLSYEQTAMKIISKTGASALIESYDAWKKHFKVAGFKEVKETDLHSYILPDLKRLEKTTDHIMKRNRRIKFCLKILPRIFVNNIIMGWIGYDAYHEGLGYYNEWICQKSQK